ncbi:MAG: threonine synthase [Pyrinomonadaceae bacterium]
MHYFSTNRNSPSVTFRDAVLCGQPVDNGLYFPSEIPKASPEFIERLREFTNEEIAFEVIRPYVDGDIADDQLFAICTETVNFPFPIVPVCSNISALELFHGPTMAFKDVGARFMSRCLKNFSSDRADKTIVIVATSGDTGGAVASGFHGVEGVEVIILYPKGRVSNIQELQLTTFGGNVTTLAIRGNFDDCQALAKQALADEELRRLGFLTSANSINVARWLPQQFYYFYAVKQLDGDAPVFSVPSGNFGNAAAGLLAWRSGLPVDKFVAACNANDVVPRFLRSGRYEPKRSTPTLSNAMDVGDPSNFVRILELFDGSLELLKEQLSAVSINDEATEDTITEVFEKHDYVLDPHGAVAFKALADGQGGGRQRGVFLATAHPVKFDSVERILGNYGVMPEQMSDLMSRKSIASEIDANYSDVRDIILDKIK